MRTQIEALAYYLPESVVTNDELHRENPAWNIQSVGEKSGIETRHVASPTETSLDLALRACDSLFADTGLTPKDVDGVIFCTQSPDYIMPSNSHLLHAHYNMRHNVLAFDIALACSGYIYALTLAHALLAAKQAERMLVVTAETYSKFIHPKDRSARVLFGDGAAATFLTHRDQASGFRDMELCSSGLGYEAFYVPAGGMRQPKSAETSQEISDKDGNVRTRENIHMDGFRVWSFINSTVPGHLKTFLARNGVKMTDIDQFIFHQASRMTLDSLIKILELDSSKVYVNMAEKGNTVSASIPIALKEAHESGVVKRGDLLLLCGFGAGFSYGSILLEY